MTTPKIYIHKGRKFGQGPKYEHSDIIAFMKSPAWSTLGFTVVSRKRPQENTTPDKQKDFFPGSIDLPFVKKLFLDIHKSLTGPRDDPKCRTLRHCYFPILLDTENRNSNGDHTYRDIDDTAIRDFFLKLFPVIRMRQMASSDRYVHAWTERLHPESWTRGQRTVIDFNYDLCLAYETATPTDPQASMRLKILIVAVTYHELAHAFRGSLVKGNTPLKFSTAHRISDPGARAAAIASTANESFGESGYVLECTMLHGCVVEHFKEGKFGNWSAIKFLSLTKLEDVHKSSTDIRNIRIMKQALVEKLDARFFNRWDSVKSTDLETDYADNEFILQDVRPASERPSMARPCSTCVSVYAPTQEGENRRDRGVYQVELELDGKGLDGKELDDKTEYERIHPLSFDKPAEEQKSM